jgi:sortase A
MSNTTLDRPTARPAAAAPARDKAGEAAGVLGDGLGVLSLLALWLVAQVLFLGGLSENRAQTIAFRELRTELAAATAPTGGAVIPGRPVALLTIPALGRELVVVEGTASGDLLSGPGHRRDTPLPGQEGVSLVYGRARTYGGPFGDLTKLRAGDSITALTQQGKATFRVDAVRRAGDPVPQPVTAGGARLTLVTAEGQEGPLSALSAGSVVYVDASLQGKAFVATPGRPVAVPQAERALATDASALPLLVLCLAAVLAVVAWVGYARRRWPTTLVWVLTAPVVLALAWSTTDVAMRLLPNLL